MNNLFFFVGIDGAGKTTTLSKLRDDYIGKSIVFTYEPFYDGYRELIKTIDNPLEKGYIFTCDRIRHFHKVVLPALARGETVFMDRCHYCNIAYQTVEAMLYSDTYAFTVQKILERIQPTIPPHKVFWFYCDPQVAYERKKEFDPEFFAEVQKVYKFILPKDRIVIDTTYDTPAETLQKVREELKNLL
jgi:dTMP kinase